MASQFYMEFEKPLAELEKKIQELHEMSSDTLDLKGEIGKLEKRAEKMRQDIFPTLPAGRRRRLPAISTGRLPWIT